MAFSTPPEVLFRPLVRALKSSSASLKRCGSSSGRSLYTAAVCTEIGKPLQIQQLPMPGKLQREQVLVSVHAAAVNFGDILKCRGQYQVKASVPYVPGTEIAGKVCAVGEGVKNVKTGDRVIAITGLTDGGYAEYCLTDQQFVLPVPDTLPMINAAATMVAYGTAMMAISRTAKVKAAETVLVTAAAGSTGLAAVDIASHVFGATVIGACGGAEKCALVRQRGGTYCIDYNAENLRDRVREITNGKGVNVVLDQVGGDTFVQCLKSSAHEGRVVTIGYASGKIPSIPANLLLLKSCAVMGVYWGNYAQANPQAFVQSIADTMKAVQDGKIHPYCGKTFPLDKVNEAFDFVTERKSTGKVVIVVKDE